MGIIQRQGIKFTIVSYLGVLIGTASMLFVYPLNLEAYGLAQFLLSSAALLAPFAILGVNILPIKFRPYFVEDKKGLYGFFTLLLITTLFISIAFVVLFFGAKSWVLQYLSLLGSKDIDQIQSYFVYLLPFTLFTAWNTILINYSISFERIVVPNILHNVLPKITLPIFVLMTVYVGINYQQFILLLIVSQILIFIGLIYYIHQQGQLFIRKIEWSKITPHTREMRNYALFGMVGGIGGILAFRIDTIMIPTLLDFSSNGAYALGVFMANAIAIPTNSLLRIASPVISSAFKREDYSNIQQIYRDSSLNLFWIGVLMYLLVLSSIHDLIQWMPTQNDLSILGSIAGILGAAKLFDMITSTNTEIISYSKFYRFNAFMIVLLGALNVLLNYYFIITLKLGLIGAALATATSLFIFNLAKGIFIWIRFRMHPFSSALLKILPVGIAIYLIATLIDVNNPLLNVVFRSGFIGIVYIWLMYKLEVSSHWNKIIDRALALLPFK